MKRSSGILMHISSLPGKYGIGDFGQGAYKFVDFLVESKQRNWQILPLGVTGFGDSPYQCFSAFAGNPYFIDLHEFIMCDYLKESDIKAANLGQDPKKVDYGLLYDNKMSLLKLAYKNAREGLMSQLENFYSENIHWLREFSLFMSLKDYEGNKSWFQWKYEYRQFDSKEVGEFERENQDKIYFWVFTQYFFTKQWKKLKSYANDRGIKIIGDLPIYVAEDSSDVWRNPKLFKLDHNLIPTVVAGCPPDGFTDTGQLWGNPIYDWDAMEEDQYKWWINRISYTFTQVDILRIDHFRGFESYWQIKYGAENAVHGQWVKGPGMKLFNKIKEELGDLNIIVEDLGFNTAEVTKLVEDAGFPNMKVLQFAFNPYEESEHMPHGFNHNSVVYTGTHDNNTAVSWLQNIDQRDLEYAIRYLKLNYDEGLGWGLIRGAWASPAKLAIAPMQDFLGLDDRARMNTPGTIGDNWTWRMEGQDLSKELSKRIRKLTEIYWR